MEAKATKMERTDPKEEPIVRPVSFDPSPKFLRGCFEMDMRPLRLDRTGAEFQRPAGSSKSSWSLAQQQPARRRNSSLQPWAGALAASGAVVTIALVSPTAAAILVAIAIVLLAIAAAVCCYALNVTRW